LYAFLVINGFGESPQHILIAAAPIFQGGMLCNNWRFVMLFIKVGAVDAFEALHSLNE